jgi:hypothetical protein
MTARRAFLALAVALAGAGAGAAHAQLVGQSLDGDNRVCTYRLNSYATPTGPDPTWRVPVAQACPTTYPGRDAQLAERPGGRANGYIVRGGQRIPLSIPSTATLSEVRREQGHVVCVYNHLGHEYLRRGSAAASCPLTPHFTPN